MKEFLVRPPIVARFAGQHKIIQGVVPAQAARGKMLDAYLDIIQKGDLAVEATITVSLPEELTNNLLLRSFPLVVIFLDNSL